MLPGERFTALWRRLGARDDGGGVLARLESAYGEPHRSYHTVAHVIACLALLDEVRSLAERPDEVEAALWFHDAVYDPRGRDNEERSAAMALETMAASGIAPEAAGRVADLVRATRDHEATSPAAALLIDIDLAILAAAPADLDHFEARIRREYAWVDEATYRAGRAAVLRRFLARPALYSTPALRDRFEVKARANLARLLHELEGRQPE